MHLKLRQNRLSVDQPTKYRRHQPWNCYECCLNVLKKYASRHICYELATACHTLNLLNGNLCDRKISSNVCTTLAARRLVSACLVVTAGLLAHFHSFSADQKTAFPTDRQTDGYTLLKSRAL